MTATEKRKIVVDAIKSREGKNTYTQGDKRTQVGSGYGDCSSTVRWCYLKLGIDIGGYTEAQLLSKTAADVALPIVNGIPDESKMRPGDLLYFRGGSQTHATRTKHVGHVEMYVGNGQISGHPSGKGPTRKSLKDYCSQKQKQYSAYATPKNCGLICVRRVVQDDASSASAVSSSSSKTSAAIAKGDLVQFSGTKHFTSSDGPQCSACSPCTGTVTAVAAGAKYPYHVEGTTVHGWVSEADVTLLKTGRIVCTSLHIRQKPDKTSSSLGIMKNGDTVTIIGDAVNDWYPIIWKGKRGYAKKSPSYIRVA